MSVQVKNIFYTQIPFVVPFKTLNEVLSGIVNEVTWYLNAPEVTDANCPVPFAGLEISTSDPNKSMYIKVKINLNDTSVMTDYYCKNKKLDIGINLQSFFKILKLIGKDENVSLWISETDKQKLTIMAEKLKPNKKIRYWNLKLREPDQKRIPSNVKDFKYHVTMSSDEFHKICQEMSSFSEYMEIKCTSNQIIFTCIGDDVDGSYILKTGENGIDIKQGGNVDDTVQIYQGVFELKNLGLFQKCTNLCTNMCLFLVNDYPLTLIYTIGSSGTMTILLSPKNDTDINNTSYNYEDDEDDDIGVINKKTLNVNNNDDYI